MLRPILIVVAAALAAAPVLAEEGPGPDKFVQKAEALFAEGRYEEAFKVYELIGREWPDERGLAAKAYVRSAECLARMGRLEDAVHRCEEALGRYQDMPDLCGHVKEVLGGLREKMRGREETRPEGPRPEARPPEGPRPEGRPAEGPPVPEEKVARHMQEVERNLREQGYAGEELERMLRKAKERFLAEARPSQGGPPPGGDPREKLRRMEQMWRESGVPEEEIRARLANLEREMVQKEKFRRGLEEERRRLEEEGVPPEEIKRRLSEMERRMVEETERGWREGREGDLENARREFIRLAERLGIPGKDAERFLMEHAPRQPFPPAGGGEGRREGLPPREGPPGGEGGDRLRALEERLERLERRIAELLERQGR